MERCGFCSKEIKRKRGERARKDADTGNPLCSKCARYLTCVICRTTTTAAIGTSKRMDNSVCDKCRAQFGLNDTVDDDLYLAATSQETLRMILDKRKYDETGVVGLLVLSAASVAKAAQILEKDGVLIDSDTDDNNTDCLWDGSKEDEISFITKPRPVRLRNVDPDGPPYRQCRMTVKFKDNPDWFCRITIRYYKVKSVVELILGVPDEPEERWFLEKISTPKKQYSIEELRRICEVIPSRLEPWIPM